MLLTRVFLGMPVAPPFGNTNLYVYPLLRLLLFQGMAPISAFLGWVVAGAHSVIIGGSFTNTIRAYSGARYIGYILLGSRCYRRPHRGRHLRYL